MKFSLNQMSFITFLLITLEIVSALSAPFEGNYICIPKSPLHVVTSECFSYEL